jgi:hypothetical protein
MSVFGRCVILTLTPRSSHASRAGDVGDTGDDDVAELLRGATPAQLARVEDGTWQGSVRGAARRGACDARSSSPLPHACG